MYLVKCADTFLQQENTMTVRFDFCDEGVLNMNNVCSVGRKIDDSVYLEAVNLQC